MWVKEQQLEPCMEQLTGSGLRKEYDRVVCLSPCLFNLYAEHTIRNARLDELEARFKIGGRNISKLRYVDDTILMAESKEEPESLLIRVKGESERAT